MPGEPAPFPSGPTACAQMGAAMFSVRPKAHLSRGVLVVAEDAGYQRRLAWRVNADSTETMMLRRRYLAPTLADYEDMVANLPPGLAVLAETPMPDREDWKGTEYTLGTAPPPPQPEAEA